MSDTEYHYVKVSVSYLKSFRLGKYFAKIRTQRINYSTVWRSTLDTSGQLILMFFKLIFSTTKEDSSIVWSLGSFSTRFLHLAWDPSSICFRRNKVSVNKKDASFKSLKSWDIYQILHLGRKRIYGAIKEPSM